MMWWRWVRCREVAARDLKVGDRILSDWPRRYFMAPIVEPPEKSTWDGRLRVSIDGPGFLLLPPGERVHVRRRFRGR